MLIERKIRNKLASFPYCLLFCSSASAFSFIPQFTAKKRGLNYHPLKDNFYSIKIKLETLFISAKIRLKLNFKVFQFFQVYVVYLLFLAKKWLFAQKLHAQLCKCAVSVLSNATALPEPQVHSLSYTHLTLSKHNKGVTYMNTFKPPKTP